MSEPISSRVIEVEGMRLHALVGGQGPPVVFLHGWPTSSFLWRHILPAVARTHRVIAPDLPGFGQSDKPTDASYSFRFFNRALSGLLDALEVGRTSLVVHDLGGPVGLHWACQDLDRIESLAILNTLAYPELSWAVVAFMMAARAPGVGGLLVSPWGLERSMKFGVAHPARLSPATIRGYQQPFADKDARRALLKAGVGLHPAGLEEIARVLPGFQGPVRLIYGQRDRILPDVARTMARLQADLPQATLTALPDCGHFLQEDAPEDIAKLLADFFCAQLDAKNHE